MLIQRLWLPVALLIGLLSAGTDADAQFQDPGDEVWLAKIRDDLSMQVTEWLEFEKAEIQYSNVWDHRYWVGTFRTRKSANMHLIVRMTEDIPESADSRIVEFDIKFSVAANGEPRLARGLRQPVPLACVGDKVRIPIRIKLGLDHDHQFELTADRFQPGVIPSRNAKSENSFTSTERPEHFRLTSEVGDFFAMNESYVTQFSNVTKSKWYASFHPELQVRQILNPVELNLSPSFESTKLKSSDHPDAEYPIKIVPTGEPVVVTVCDWLLSYEYQGERTNRGSESLSNDVIMIRPNDKFWPLPSLYPEVTEKSDWGSFPNLKLMQLPFKVSKPTFRNEMENEGNEKTKNKSR